MTSSEPLVAVWYRLRIETGVCLLLNTHSACAAGHSGTLSWQLTRKLSCFSVPVCREALSAEALPLMPGTHSWSAENSRIVWAQL